MPLYVSASLINDFVSCNRQAYYRINKTDKQIDSRESIIGDVVHRAIETHWNDKESANAFAVSELSLRSTLDDESESFSRACLDNFFHNFSKYLSDDDQIEYKFKISLGKDVFLVGKMDRISNGNVFDWKTTRGAVGNLSNNVQFIIYNWAYRKLFSKEPTGLYYASLTRGELHLYKRNDDMERYLFEKTIPQIIKSIKEKDYTPYGLFRGKCFRCSYREACHLDLRNNELASSTSN